MEELEETTIYLSSTYEDLTEHRRAVFDALRKSGYTVIAMEDYVARDQRPLEACLRDIGESADIYVGIFAFRYGYIPPQEHVHKCEYTAQHDDWQGLSITELEFRYAQETGLPVLTFIVKEGTPWSSNYIDAYTERHREHPGDNIDQLRNYLLREKLASEFSSPFQLASLVQAAVAKHLQTSGKQEGGKKPGPPAITWDLEKDESPYPGLMHFTRRYAPVFFGREAEVREILERLFTHRPRFILVSGDSGVGKSSFVHAGLLPKLEESGLPGGHDCLSVRMVPSQGLDPFDALMRALHVQAERAGFGSYTLGEQLRDKPADLPDRIGEIIAKGIDRSALLLFLDQMEEHFTGKAREYADTFLTALHGATLKKALWVVATIRSDHLHHCYRHPDLLQVLRSQGHYPLGPVDPTVMADMIKKPAQCTGLEIADGLVRRIIGESGSEPGSLPLLAFVLRRLFDQRDGPALTEQVYNSFNGIDGAVAHHVSDVEHKLRTKIGAALNDLMPKLFQAVLVVDPEGLPTRRRALLCDFNNELGVLVDELIKARLFSTEGEGMDSTVSIAHEKLFDAWPALAFWITENKDDLWLRRQLSQAATEWEARGQEKKYRWPDDRVIDVVGMLNRLGLGIDDLSDRERRFLGPIDRGTMLTELETLDTSHERRATIGVRLSLLGDPRPGVGLDTNALPDIDWCKVLGGEITIEKEQSKKLARFLGASRTKTWRCEPFYIAKYPVTWIQYRSFLEADDGFKDSKWWQGLLFQVEEEHRQFNQRDNHPVENLCWLEAVAFSRWLTAKLGYEVRLPTEWEWQQAATGGNPENEYPWGAWDSSYANTYESGLNRSTAVGMYPHGASPDGALDMSGNVFEWCLNEYEKPDRIDVAGEARRAVRGGSWDYYQDFALCAFRYSYGLYYPDFRYYGLGFRLLCSSPIF